MKPQELPLPAQLMKLIVGRWISKPIYVAAELQIADLLAAGPLSIEALAQQTQTHAPSLYRVLRALASVGIFTETSDKYFALTPMAEFLKTGALRSAAIMFNADWSDRAWEFFLDSVQTGENAFEKAHGMTLEDWLEKNPVNAKIFNEANAIKAQTTHRAVVDHYDFSAIKSLTDIGGGTGALLLEILKANSQMTGIVADRPDVVAEAKRSIQNRGMEARCRVLACDFLQEIPGGSEMYLMSHILHDWPDAKCRLILKNCYRAMQPGSRLIIVEMIVPPGNTPAVAKLLDMEMLVITGGRERTEAELGELLEVTGFKLARVISTRENIDIIEAIRN